MSTLKVGWREVSYLANEGVCNFRRGADERLNQRFCRIKVATVELGTAFQQGFSSLSTHLIERKERVSHRVCAHFEQTAVDACSLVGHAQRVELSCYLFVREFFGKVVDAQNVFFGVRTGKHAVQAQVAMEAQANHKCLDGERCLLQQSLVLADVLCVELQL